MSVLSRLQTRRKRRSWIFRAGGFSPEYSGNSTHHCSSPNLLTILWNLRVWDPAAAEHRATVSSGWHPYMRWSISLPSPPLRSNSRSMATLQTHAVQTRVKIHYDMICLRANKTGPSSKGGTGVPCPPKLVLCPLPTTVAQNYKHCIVYCASG